MNLSSAAPRSGVGLIELLYPFRRPDDLKLQLLLFSAALVFDIKRRARGNAQLFSGNLYGKSVLFLNRVCQTAEFVNELSSTIGFS